MTLWLVRAGRYGEREQFAVENNLAIPLIAPVLIILRSRRS